MTRRKLLRVIVPLCAALLLTIVVARATSHPATKGVPLLEAAVQVSQGTILSPADLKVVKVSPQALLPGSLSSEGQAAGQVTLVALSPGSPILANDVEARTQAGLAYAIPSGERAMTLAVNSVSGVAGNLATGSRVDVLLTLSAQAAQPATQVPAEPPLSTVVASDLQVLATGIAGSTTSSGYAVVTLAVTPEEAATIALSQQQGTLTLLLRGPKDTSRPATEVRLGGDVP